MVDVLEKICMNMDCNIEDIMEIYPDPVDSIKSVQPDQCNENGELKYD